MRFKHRHCFTSGIRSWALCFCTLLALIPTLGFAQRAKLPEREGYTRQEIHRHSQAGNSGRYEGRGVVYMRTDPLTGKKYVGQSWEWETFEKRMEAHDKKLQEKTNNPAAAYKFEVLSRPLPSELDMVEEGFIRKGGIEREGGELENKRHQVKKWDEKRASRKAEDADSRYDRRVEDLKNKNISDERREEARKAIREQENAMRERAIRDRSHTPAGRK